MRYKKCAKCGPQPIQTFGRNRQSKDGLDYYCLVCSRERRRLWYVANPNSALAAQERYRSRIRQSNIDRDPYMDVLPCPVPT